VRAAADPLTAGIPLDTGWIIDGVTVLDALVPRLARLPGVVAVVLGGSRARGTHRPDSDWDVGLYYRGDFDARVLADLGLPGHVAQPGEWGRIVNGGAWLSVEGTPVDVLLRDLDVVEGWYADARAGRFDIDNVEGHIAGLPTYTPVGEMAVSRVLAGELPPVSYPDALRDTAGRRWRWNGAFSLLYAERYAARGDVTLAAGTLARATVQTAHGVLAERGEWVLNEKGLVDAAGLGAAHAIVGGCGDDPVRAVAALRDLLDPPPLHELRAHPEAAG
jgi:predicted nucleotidyltransferase